MLLTQKRKFVWIYTTLWSTDFLYGNGVEFYQLKATRFWKKKKYFVLEILLNTLQLVTCTKWSKIICV